MNLTTARSGRSGSESNSGREAWRVALPAGFESAPLARGRVSSVLAAVVGLLTLVACASGGAPSSATPSVASHGDARLAQIYFWRAKPGKLEEYTRYIRDVAEPIDEEARRAGAFVSVATYMASDTTVPWTHMRVFTLRDSAQLRALGGALSAAGTRLQPDSVKRRQQSEYSATLRDRVGAVVAELVR